MSQYDPKDIHLMAAELIAREFSKQRYKQHERRITITIEQWLKENTDPTTVDLELIERGDKIYVTNRKPTKKKEKRELSELNEQKEIEKKEQVTLEQWRAGMNKCNTCSYEMIYEQYPEDTFRTEDIVLHVRDCINPKAED